MNVVGLLVFTAMIALLIWHPAFAIRRLLSLLRISWLIRFYFASRIRIRDDVFSSRHIC